MLTISNLGKWYPLRDRKNWVFRHLDFEFPNRGLLAIVGPSGSGKSTLLNVLALLESPSEGEIYWNGHRLDKASSSKAFYHNKITGFVYQHFNLFEEMSVRENVAMPLLVQGQSRNQCLRQADSLLTKWDMDDLAFKKVALLSGGEKQRTAILRATINSPAILFADEPTGALDGKNAERIMDDLKEFSTHSLVVLVSHDEAIVQKYADSVFSFQKGWLRRAKALPTSAASPVSSSIRPHSCHWIFSFIHYHFHQDIGKEILSFFAATLGFLSLLFSFGFYEGSSKLAVQSAEKSLLYSQMALSKQTFMNFKDSPLSLSRAERPDSEEVAVFKKEFPFVEIKEDYSFFLPSSHAFCLDLLEKPPVIFSPLACLTLRNRKTTFSYEGDLPSSETLSECLVNDAFARLFSKNVRGRMIRFSVQTTGERFGVKDDIQIDYSFRIVGILKEFAFLNSPRVYYSYPALNAFLAQFPLPHISSQGKRAISAADLVCEADGHSPYSSYRYLVFIPEEKVPILWKKAKELSRSSNGLFLASDCFSIHEAFKNLAGALDKSLAPFLLLQFVVFAFTIGSLTCASFFEKRKEAAILRSLGALAKDQLLIYALPSLFISLFSLVVSLFASFFLEPFFNAFLFKKIALGPLIQIPFVSYQGHLFALENVLISVLLLIWIISSVIPLLIAMRRKLVGELREE